MKNLNEIRKEIEAVGLRVEIYSGGFNIFPSEKDAPVIYNPKLEKLIAIVRKYNFLWRIDFDTRLVRVH